ENNKEQTCSNRDEHVDAHHDNNHYNNHDNNQKSSIEKRPEPIRIERHVHQMNSQTLWAALGAFLGAIVIAFTFVASVEHGHGEGSRTFVETFLELAVESAPALFVAYLLAGIVSATLTAKHSQWLKRGGSVRQSLQGVLFGLPLPICSCGVLPLYETLVKRGVPATAAMGFLIATPELGIDAILLSIPLLGGEMTIARLVSAFLVALIVAVVLGRSVQRTSPERLPEIKQEEGSLVERLKTGLHFGLFELFDHTMPWILMGLAVAAWLDPILGSGLLAGVPSYIQVPMFALIGIPLYVCASGATPIAAIAIYNGISPGAALAFLLAGPATNITTFGVLTGLHSKKTAISFGVLVTFLAILTGWSIDWLTIQTQGEIYEHSYDSHSIFAFLAMALLGLMFVGSVLRQGPRGMLEQVIHPMEHQH
ncbi:MAG: permease, partial [Myxococcota bacterium]|nr:permease [Myxococcota bacterium]